MNMYYRLRKQLVRESAAIAELERFCAVNARIHAIEPGRYVLLVPAGRRPAGVLRFLQQQAPHDEWDLCGWDQDDGVVNLPDLSSPDGGDGTQ